MEFNELIEGEIYYEQVGDYKFISKNGLNKTLFFIQNNNKFDKDGEKIYKQNVIRIATDFEKAWLNACILADEFIPQDQIPNNELLIQNLIIW